MTAHMNFTSFVDNTRLKISLDVIRYAVGAVTSPWKVIKFPPTLSPVRCVSAFCGRILAKIIPYVTVLPIGTFPLRIKKMVFIPDVVLVPTPWASRTISFSNEFYQMDLVGPLIRFLYSSDAPVFRSITTLS